MKNSNSYFNELSKYPVLSNEEQQELIKNYHRTKDTKFKTKLINHNLKLVLSIAKKYKVKGMNFLDLVQEGNIGLIKAVDKYDSSAGTKFTSYAGYWIKAMIFKAMIENHSLIKIGTTQEQRRLFFNISKVKKSLELQGKEVSAENIAKELKADVSLVDQLLIRMNTDTVSIDVDSSDDAPTPVHIQTSDSDSPTTLLETAESKHKLKILLEKFHDQLSNINYKLVFRKRYMEDKESTFAEIGKECGFSRQRAQQIEEKINPKLMIFLKENMI